MLEGKEMAKYEGSIQINASPKKVWDYLTVTEKTPEWIPNLAEVKNIKGAGVGKTWDWAFSMAGIPLKGKTEVVEQEPEKKEVAKIKGGIECTWTTTLDKVEKGTKVHMAIEYKIPVPVVGKIAEKVLVKMNKNSFDAMLQNVKELIET